MNTAPTDVWARPAVRLYPMPGTPAEPAFFEPAHRARLCVLNPCRSAGSSRVTAR